MGLELAVAQDSHVAGRERGKVLMGTASETQLALLVREGLQRSEDLSQD